MKKILVILSLIILSACGQDYNSNTADGFVYTPSGIADPDLSAAYDVLKIRCIQCHYHTGWAAYKTNQQWVDAGLVISADFENSFLVRSLKNFPDGSMPKDSGPLPASELQTIEDWINSI
ncbi:MAG: hypothetical protein JNM93_12795 [Bacteriovoracaceae bacterium]|nr:hypothetical protein [Bacteriovoracaceae bacterium]